ncbi:MAG: PAS domain S-box protein [Chitinophagaceae bacterium]|nr:PAS domain S-box protein [Chitinophagaceae bacterium]
MKWQINRLVEPNNEDTTYFCLGYKILDTERQNRFNSLVRNHCQLIIEGLTGVLFQDSTGELIAANQKLASMFETTLEKLYCIKNVASLWDNEWAIEDENGATVPFEESPFRLTQKTGQSHRKTIVVTLPNGNKHWLLFNSQILAEEEENGLPFVVSSVIDITRERKLHTELKDGEHLMKAFLQETPNPAWVIDEDETLLFASKAFLEHFNIKEADAIGNKVTHLVPPSISEALYKDHLEVLYSGNPLQITRQLELATGQNIVTLINIFPINMPSGRRLLGGQSVSLAEKTKLEKELMRAQERLWTLNRATSDAIWEWDMQNGQIFRNETLMEMIGYQPDNSRGLSWWLRRIHPEDRNRVADKVKEATDHLQPSWQDSYRFKCADGSYKFVQDRGFVVYENGLPVKMIGSLQDISAIKELETKLNDERLHRQKEISETVIQVAEDERTKLGHELHDNVNQVLSTAKLFVDMLAVSSPDQQTLKDKGTDYITLAIEEIRKLSRDLVAPQLKEEKTFR